MGEQPDPEESKRFRRALGNYPTGVVAVTASSPEHGEVGLLVGSFTSVSLNPQLVGFLVDHASTSWPLIRQCDGFAINVLAADQIDVGREFSRSGGDKFENVDWWRSDDNAPIIDNCVLAITCTLREEYPMGDHAFVLANVRSYEVHREHVPLVFSRGRFGTVSELES